MPVLYGREALVRDGDHCCLGKEKVIGTFRLCASVLCHFCHTETVGLEPGGCSAVEGTCILEGLLECTRLPLPLLLDLGFLGDSVRSCPVGSRSMPGRSAWVMGSASRFLS